MVLRSMFSHILGSLPFFHNLLFFFNDTPTTEIYTLSLHDALPIWDFGLQLSATGARTNGDELLGIRSLSARAIYPEARSEEHTSDSSHANISYAVFCLKKKNNCKTRWVYDMRGGTGPSREYHYGAI